MESLLDENQSSNELTNCFFKLVGVKDFQDAVKRLKRHGHRIKLIRSGRFVYGLNCENNEILGRLTDYFADLLIPVIDQEKDKCLYAVTDIPERRKLRGVLRGVRAILEYNEKLPNFILNRSGLRVWYCTIKGVTYAGRRYSLREAVNEMDVTKIFPSITLRREYTNSHDKNAILIFGYVRSSWHPFGYIDKWDAQDICDCSQEKKYKFYSRLVDLGLSDGKGSDGEDVYYGKYEVVGIQPSYASTDFNELQ